MQVHRASGEGDRSTLAWMRLPGAPSGRSQRGERHGTREVPDGPWTESSRRGGAAGVNRQLVADYARPRAEEVGEQGEGACEERMTDQEPIAAELRKVANLLAIRPVKDLNKGEAATMLNLSGFSNPETAALISTSEVVSTRSTVCCPQEGG